MNHTNDVSKKARNINKLQRIEFIKSFRETELHKQLKILFENMEPDCLVEVTHGSREFGKDLVIVKKNNISSDIIGVVVKVGDITGDTLGHVDEIKVKIKRINKINIADKKVEEIISQIDQAKNNPTQLKNKVENLPVTQIHVVVAGSLSNQANSRILNEIKPLTGKIIDIDNLVDYFTEHYPEVFFEGRVLNFIEDKIQYLEMRNWLGIRKNNKNLSEYFVPPTVGQIELPIKLDSENFNLLLKNSHNNFHKLYSLINQKKNILIVGDPGSGKSTAIAKITIDLLNDAITQIFNKKGNNKINIPIVVTAKELLNIDNVDQLIHHFIPNVEILSQFTVDKLFIDGLDEIRTSNRLDIINKAKLFKNELNSSLIITSRKVDIVNQDIPGFEKYELLSFEYKEAIDLCSKLIDNTDQLAVLKDGLERLRNQIPITPLSILFLIELVESQKEIPASLTELYDRFINISLGSEDKNKGIEVLFEYKVKRKFLSSLAYNVFLIKDCLQVSFEEFHVFAKNYASEYGISDLLNFKGEIERTGLLCLRDNNFEFKHRTFLDFFAANYIHEHLNEIHDSLNFLTGIYYEEFWGDTLFFVVGLNNEISKELINNILSYPYDDFDVNVKKYMIGKLLQAGWLSKQVIKNDSIFSALQFAPKIRNRILDITDKLEKKVPRIIADFLLLNLANESLKSNFLYDSLKHILNNEMSSSNPNVDNLYIVFYSLSPLLLDDEYIELAQKILDLISKTPNIEIEAKMRTLILLSLEAKRNQEIEKLIKHKATKLIRNNNYIAQKLLPERKKGFRPKHN